MPTEKRREDYNFVGAYANMTKPYKFLQTTKGYFYEK